MRINHANYSASFAAFALFAPSLNYVLSKHFGYEYDELVTAVLLFGFSIPALLLCFFDKNNEWGKGAKLVLTFVFFLILAWLLRYVIDIESGVLITDFDKKRPYFAILGIFVYGSIGVMAAISKNQFIENYLNCVMIFGLLLSAMYLTLYDVESSSARIGNDAGLIIGILIAQAIGALLYKYQKDDMSGLISLIIFLIMVLALFMSGTRSALFATVLNIFVLVVFSNVLNKIKLIILVMCGSFFAWAYLIDFLPVETLLRVTNFKLEGSENRVDLLKYAIESILSNIFGKTVGYIGVYPEGIEYAHNTTIQLIAELGFFALPFFIFFLLGMVFWLYLLQKKQNKYDRDIVYYAIPVFVISLSAGDAYTAQFWFMVTLLSTYGYTRCKF